MRSYCFRDEAHDILIREERGVLTIRQHGRCYRALRWQMTEELVCVLRTAIGFGLTRLWQVGHPRGPDSSHISFSRTHAPRSWVFALGLEARPPRLRTIAFSKRFLAAFETSGLSWSRRGGAAHLFVAPERLGETLAALGGHY